MQPTISCRKGRRREDSLAIVTTGERRASEGGPERAGFSTFSWTCPRAFQLSTRPRSRPQKQREILSTFNAGPPDPFHFSIFGRPPAGNTGDTMASDSLTQGCRNRRPRALASRGSGRSGDVVRNDGYPRVDNRWQAMMVHHSSAWLFKAHSAVSASAKKLSGLQRQVLRRAPPCALLFPSAGGQTAGQQFRPLRERSWRLLCAQHLAHGLQ